MAVVIPRLGIGGTEHHLLDILPRIDRHWFDITVVTTRGAGPLDEELRQQGISVVYATTARKRLLSLVGSFFGTMKYLRRERPDIVHFFLPEAYFIGGLCSVLLGQGNRVMSRRSLNLYHRRRRFSATIERWLHRRMDVVIANSNAVAKELADEGVARDQLRTVYSGISADIDAAMTPSIARQQLALDDNMMVFVGVANLIPYKGHRDLLEAFAIAAPRFPDNWQFLAVGRDDGIGAQLRDHAETLGLTDNIRWVGERRDVPIFLKASDVAVLTSHEEGLPKSIIEAMAAGLPCVVTGVGGTPEAVIDGVTGKVVAVHDTAALAEALVELANDPELRAQFGRAAKARVDQLFRVETCVAEYERIYETLIERSGEASRASMPMR
ncbi:MAG: glycosyltransferase [Alphaproteobacteria bacterium]|nr:glycosyltransferase [Alphaproteobacteria bacterium]